MTALALLAALAAGINHSPAPPKDCAFTIPVLAISAPPVMAGNMRTVDGGCIVWASAGMFLGRRTPYDTVDACKVAMHETLHLAGRRHSLNPSDVMFSPYLRDPVPDGCRDSRTN